MMLQVVYILNFVGQSIHPFGLDWRDGGFMPGLLGCASFLLPYFLLDQVFFPQSNLSDRPNIPGIKGKMF